MSLHALKAGDFVEHATWGLGKVLFRDGDNCRIYFKAKPSAVPEDRTAEFAISSDKLKSVDIHPDVELDNLPPWRDGRFLRYSTPETFEKAKQRFLGEFSKGFDDPLYWERERRYKLAAHERYRKLFAKQARGWLDAGDCEAVVDGLDAVYGDRRAAVDSPEARLNLMYARVEEPAFFEALRQAPDLTLTYAKTALDFIDNPTEPSFEVFRRALESLPTRPGGAELGHWTTLTWLPFVGSPSDHILVKPTITQTFASITAFDIQYRPSLNFETYRRAVALGKQVRGALEASELNIRQRTLDMIDVQSFMWVVLRYREPTLG
jgi:hypothetical protein